MSNTGKVALITGANKGIGYEIARGLGEQGYTVLIGARDPERGEEAARSLRETGSDARWIALEVTDRASIARAASVIESDYGKLDALVNNAGIAIESEPPSTSDNDALRRTYDVNFFGAVQVAQAMLPLLRKSAAGRIVNMSSGLGSLAQNSDSYWMGYDVNILAYNSSKTALNAFTVMLAKELANTPIKVNAADPGYCSTDLNQHRGPRTPAQGAAIGVKLATLPVEGPTGGYFDDNGRVPW